jgi:putative ABC transport system permease protein
VINETMAQRYWPGQSPIGKQISFENRDGKPVFREIVGVVADIHHEGADSPEVPAAYIPYAQRPSSSLALVARTDGDPAKAAEAVRAAVREIDPNLPVYGVRTMEDALGESLAPRRYGMLLLGLFGLVALVLAAIGIYGVMSYLVAQRTNEIGIRMALGAERRSVLGLVLRQGMLMAVAGVAAGVVVAYGVSRLISSQLYVVCPADPWAFAFATCVLVAVAVVACLVPARRATKVDPMVALHYE